MIAMREVRDIYHQGVWAVAAAFRQLYEMIEVKDEQVQKLIAVATAAHLKKIEELHTRIFHLEEELLNRKRQIRRQQLTTAELNEQIAQLQHGVKDLNKQLKGAREETRLTREAHLASVMKNSQNSSRPPSSDRHKRTRSLREKSGRRPGGQVGHPGATLEFVGQPDHLIVHAAKECHLCGSSLKGGEVVKCERLQVYDLPPLGIEVTEHRAQTIICHQCGVKNKANGGAFRC